MTRWLVLVLISSLGMALGITGAGKLWEGQGEIGYAMGGIAAGAIPTYLLSKGWGSGSFSETSAQAFVFVSALIGGTIAYEISHHRVVRELRSRHNAGVQVMPVVTLSRTGSLLGGLAGCF